MGTADQDARKIGQEATLLEGGIPALGQVILEKAKNLDMLLS
jgi:hypothetical protein